MKTFGACVSWGLCVVCALGTVALAVSGRVADATVPNAWFWLADVWSNLASQFLVAGIIGLVLASLLRRWVCGVVLLAGVLVLSVTILGTPRAPVDAGATGPRVRILVFNALSKSETGPEQLDLILGSGADLVAVIEPSPSLLEQIRSDARLAEAYPYHRLPARAGPGFRFVLSRHPLLRDEDGFGFVWPELRRAFGYHGTRVLRVETPAGPFVFVLVQMRSPRNASRWAVGNSQVMDAVRGLVAMREATRLPIVIAGDFNGSPTGWRVRTIADETGLLYAKPVLRAAGSYPAMLPWPAQTVIDGAMVSEGVRVVSWGVLGSAGSDHEAVLIELSLPGVEVPR